LITLQISASLVSMSLIV